MRTHHVVFKFFVTPFSIVCAANEKLQLKKNEVEHTKLLLDVNSLMVMGLMNQMTTGLF